MVIHEERWPPALVARVIYLSFAPVSRRQDYLAFVSEYREKVCNLGCKRAKRWARWQAADSVWRAVPSTVKQAVLAAIIKWVLKV